MNTFFWLALTLMTFGAIAILLQPALRRVRSSDNKSTLPILLTAFLVPVLTVGLYAYLGSPKAAVANPERSASLERMRQVSNEQASQKQIASVSNLVDGLATRLADNPDDAGGWLLLAKSHRHLGNREDASSAYENAVALGKHDADLQAYLASDGKIDSRPPGIKGRVTISDTAATDVDGSATVFVIARAAGGSPVPLAVLRTPVSTLPFEFSLHDGQAMVAGKELSSADSVIVTAKISANGDALSTVPGYETHSDPVMTADPGFVILDLEQQ
jgi:hypothetical protein